MLIVYIKGHSKGEQRNVTDSFGLLMINKGLAVEVKPEKVKQSKKSKK
jgi:hypothetical protein